MKKIFSLLIFSLAPFSYVQATSYPTFVPFLEKVKAVENSQDAERRVMLSSVTTEFDQALQQIKTGSRWNPLNIPIMSPDNYERISKVVREVKASITALNANQHLSATLGKEDDSTALEGYEELGAHQKHLSTALKNIKGILPASLSSTTTQNARLISEKLAVVTLNELDSFRKEINATHKTLTGTSFSKSQ